MTSSRTCEARTAPGSEIAIDLEVEEAIFDSIEVGSGPNRPGDHGAGQRPSPP
jgi:hypothetical protein